MAAGARRAKALDGGLALALAFGLLIATAAALPPSVALSARAAAGEIALLAGVAVLLGMRRLEPRDTLSLRLPGGWGLLLAVAGTALLHFLLSSVAEPLEELFRWGGVDSSPWTAEFERRILDERARAPLSLGAAVVLLPAVCEEALFRGVVLSGFGRSWGPVAALVTSSVLFGLVHEIPERMVLTALIGAWLGACVLATRSLLAGVAGHALNNGLALGLGGAGPPPPLWLVAFLLPAFLVCCLLLRPVAARRT